MERILLIEDDQALGRGTALALAGEGREIRVAATLAQGWAALGEGEYALVLLDLNLPDGNGLDFLTALRRTSGVPVLIITAREEEKDKILGLDLGADDYITKPFSVRELMARVKAHIRRVALIRQSAGNQEDRLDFGRLVIHKESAQATKDGERLELTQREFELLTYLASHAGRVFSRQELMERVWNYEGYVGDVRGVDVAVRRLREKLEDDPAQPKYIITRRGAGYYFQKDL